jgi:dUTPase
MTPLNPSIVQNLLTMYERVMVLKIFVDSNDIQLKSKYYMAANMHNNNLQNMPQFVDAGFDLYAPGSPVTDYNNEIYFFDNQNCANKLDFNINCSAQMYLDNGKVYSTGYYMYPRSSISKTPLRLANCTGIIDAGYRGHICGMFDVKPKTTISNINLINNEADYVGQKFDRYVQICAPGLVPIVIEVVENIQELGEETMRGDGGFGSTGR